MYGTYYLVLHIVFFETVGIFAQQMWQLFIYHFFFLELELQMELWNGILGAVVGMSCSLNLFFKIKSLRVTERIQQCAWDYLTMSNPLFGRVCHTSDKNKSARKIWS